MHYTGDSDQTLLDLESPSPGSEPAASDLGRPGVIVASQRDQAGSDPGPTCLQINVTVAPGEH